MSTNQPDAPASPVAAAAVRDAQSAPTDRRTPSPAAYPRLFLRGEAPDLAGFIRPSTGWPQVERRASEPVRDGDGHDSNYQRLRALLHTRATTDRQFAEEAAEGRACGIARAEEIETVLRTIQSQPAPPVMRSGILVHRPVSQVRQDLLNRLREYARDGRPPQPSDADIACIELVGLLFEQIAGTAHADSPVQELLVKLQVPMLRAALKDAGFFTQKGDPAAGFLGAVFEHAARALRDDSDDRVAVDQIEVFVNRAIAQYNGDNQLFDRLLGEFAASQVASIRKSELAERRTIEAAKGRERLELARREAAAAIARCVETAAPSPLLRAVLEQAWTKVLELTILRDGPLSATFKSRLALVDRLIEVLAQPQIANSRTSDPTEIQALRRELEIGLEKVAFHSDDILLLLDRLFSGDPSMLQANCLKELELAPKAHVARDLERGADAVSATDAAAPTLETPLNTVEKNIHRKLRELQAGVWMEFVVNARGEVARRKLAWVSTVEDRCLIINQRGARSADASIEWVAREINLGRARLVPATSDTVVERALRAVASQLL